MRYRLPALFFACATCAAGLATPVADTDDTESNSIYATLPEGIEELKGVDVNNDFKSLVSVGNSVSATQSGMSYDELMSHVFLFYNIGQKKFLSSGNWWGMHGNLTDHPRLFWLQERDEERKTRTQVVKYPFYGDQEVLVEPSTKDPTTEITKLNSHALLNGKATYSNWTTPELGSQEGYGRSRATYKSVKLITTTTVTDKSTGESTSTETERDLLLESGLISASGEEYKPDGAKFYIKQFSSDDAFDFNTMRIEAVIDIANCDKTKNTKNKPDNILSFGKSIKDWKDNAQLHIYYDSSAKQLIAHYLQPANADNNNTEFNGESNYKATVDAGNTTTILKITLSKDGLTVEGLDEKFNPGLKVPYVEGKEGQDVEFKYDSESATTPSVGSDNYYVIASDGDAIKKTFTTEHKCYAWTGTNSDGTPKAFISSRIKKVDSSWESTEGKYLAYAYYDQTSAAEGNVGLYIDRNSTYFNNSTDDSPVGPKGSANTETSAWSFEKVEYTETDKNGDTHTGNNIYKLSLTMPYKEDGKVETEKVDGHTKRNTFYLQASRSYVTGYPEEDGTKGDHYYYDLDTSHDGSFATDATTAELLIGMPDDSANALWKIISLNEYIQMLKGVKTEMQNPIEISYLLNDPDFSRENDGLSKWKIEPGLESASVKYDEAKIRFGLDGYYKTSPQDKNYLYLTDDTGQDSHNNLLRTHGRYMCAQMQRGGRGKLYQDIAVYSPGWYEVRCQGMTNINSKLFVQRLDEMYQTTEPTSDPITHELAKISTAEVYALNMGYTNAHWPFYDHMPMYNACVLMNDGNLPAEQSKYAEYRNSVLIFVETDKDGNDVDYDHPAFLRLGIDVQKNDDSLVAEDDEWTTVDDFHLFFGGKAAEPHLILDETRTDLGYLDKTINLYTGKTMHLYRTFTKDVWNTLMLPVSMSAEQVKTAFGEDAKLATLYELTDRSVRFVYADAIEAYKPYIIKPTKENGGSGAYTTTLRYRDSESSLEVTAPENNFVVENVTLEPKQFGTDDYRYDFANIDICNAEIDGEKYGYVVDAKSSAEGTGGKLHCYGTLCKTYETVGSILDGRPHLDNGNAYIMKGGTMYRVPGASDGMVNGYGLKGFRCWFQYEDNAQQSEANDVRLIINGIEDDTDGMESIAAADGMTAVSKFAKGTYDISGRKISDSASVDNLPKGVYIVNGKKFIAR